MMDQQPLIIFGEVLFDCFPTGESVLGGAPFNVAWHLQALGDEPKFISAVGDDDLGHQIIKAMQAWHMDTRGVQLDHAHPTGQVSIVLQEGEPHYTIMPDCAYDFIQPVVLEPQAAMLYHGSLGLRQARSRQSLERLTAHNELSVFLDVNLRAPWWQSDDVRQWLARARWVKLNEHELRDLGFVASNIRDAMAQLQQAFDIELVIVTRGEQGAIVRSAHGDFYSLKPEPVKNVVDTVGAGDGFTALFIHGLRLGWPMNDILAVAQQFACEVIGQRGAISDNIDFYRPFRVKK